MSGTVTAKARYRVDFARQMAECEANYARMMKLLPSLHKRDSWNFDVVVGQGHWQIAIEIVERARFTTTVVIHQEDNLQQWNDPARLQVRLYHDAQVAEVLHFQHHPKMQARYEYPNRQMYQSDEKAQVNQFLGEWLSHCLAHGCSGQGLEAFGLTN